MSVANQFYEGMTKEDILSYLLVSKALVSSLDTKDGDIYDLIDNRTSEYLQDVSSLNLNEDELYNVELITKDLRIALELYLIPEYKDLTKHERNVKLVSTYNKALAVLNVRHNMDTKTTYTYLIR